MTANLELFPESSNDSLENPALKANEIAEVNPIVNENPSEELLIPIVDRDGRKAVNARDLHEFLGSKQQFADWVKNRIEKYELIENEDYTVFHNFMKNSKGGRAQIEYALSLDAAKELSMVEGNEKGKMARKYFIACEKKLKEGAGPSYMIEDPIKRAERWIEEQKERLALEASNKMMAPKAEYFDNLVERNLLTNFRTTAAEIGLRQNEFIGLLLKHGYVYRDAANKLKPYAQYIPEFFEIKDYTSKNNNHAGTQTLVTPKGKETFRLLWGRKKK